MPLRADQVQSFGVARTFSSAALAGAPVYVDGGGSVDLAQADAEATSDVVGLAFSDVGAAVDAAVVDSGTLQLSTAQWDAVAGTSGGLTPGQKYYASEATAGRLTDTPPTGSGEYQIEVGVGLSATELDVRVRERFRKA